MSKVFWLDGQLWHKGRWNENNESVVWFKMSSHPNVPQLHCGTPNPCLGHVVSS